MNRNPVFFNEIGRLRSGWRFAIFVSLFIVGSIILGVTLQFIYSPVPNPVTRTFLFASAGLSLITALLLGWVCGKYLDGVPFKALGATFSRGWFAHFVWGSFNGAVTLLIGVGIAMEAAGYRFRIDVGGVKGIVQSALVSMAVFAAAAAFEEALFRGYILQTFARANLSWLAIGLTALFFGAVHLGNPDANFISTLNTILAGIWFGIAYLKTRDLWFPFGMHLMWNWMQGSVFGIEVSGLTNISPDPILHEIDPGPAWITGAGYGIEAGIVTTVAIIISIAAIHFIPFLKADEELVELTSKEVPTRSTVS